MPAADLDAATAFYERLFGWQINPRPRGEFHQMVPGEGLHLGLFSETGQPPDPDPGPPPPRSSNQPRVYILVDSTPADYLARAVELGATVVWEQQWWSEFDGHHASFRDPWGNQIVLWNYRGE
ncbi:MAG TPA: VOC family protein [Candidatus Dormibacteraeota bacterium]|jgi:predicted enzyme related to lactoylglutathione lyase|nr:VOC family protein [Candidatus Dormibacteraeota bacterium]